MRKTDRVGGKERQERDDSARGYPCERERRKEREREGESDGVKETLLRRKSKHEWPKEGRFEKQGEPATVIFKDSGWRVWRARFFLKGEGWRQEAG